MNHMKNARQDGLNRLAALLQVTVIPPQTHVVAIWDRAATETPSEKHDQPTDPSQQRTNTTMWATVRSAPLFKLRIEKSVKSPTFSIFRMPMVSKSACGLTLINRGNTTMDYEPYHIDIWDPRLCDTRCTRPKTLGDYWFPYFLFIIATAYADLTVPQSIHSWHADHSAILLLALMNTISAIPVIFAAWISYRIGRILFRYTHFQARRAQSFLRR